MKSLIKNFALALVTLLVMNFDLKAQNVKAAAAANLQSVIKVLIADFNKRTGIAVEPIISSSGNLTTQIRNGAPFDIFLSADMNFPEALFKDGLTTKKPVAYAMGSLIICSRQNLNVENWEKLLMSAAVNKIAVANPAIAPYGKAAEEALTKKGILDQLKPKIVTGESISQVNTYITTGVAEVGFTTQSFIKDADGKTKLYYKVIDPKLYSPIVQGVVLLKHGEDNPAAEKFYTYLLSKPAKAIFREYGYLVK
jgi:molybdate transport system substrate-binding protein